MQRRSARDAARAAPMGHHGLAAPPAGWPGRDCVGQISYPNPREADEWMNAPHTGTHTDAHTDALRASVCGRNSKVGRAALPLPAGSASFAAPKNGAPSKSHASDRRAWAPRTHRSAHAASRRGAVFPLTCNKRDRIQRQSTENTLLPAALLPPGRRTLGPGRQGRRTEPLSGNQTRYPSPRRASSICETGHRGTADTATEDPVVPCRALTTSWPKPEELQRETRRIQCTHSPGRPLIGCARRRVCA